MADERDEERTEPASPRRREEARERGQVARSADLSSAVILLAAVLALRFLGRSMIGGIFASAATVLEGLAMVDGDPSTPAGLRDALATAEIVPGRASYAARLVTPVAKLVQRGRGVGR